MIGIDSVLHILVGGIITLFMFYKKHKGLSILFILAVIAACKELYDHYITLGHCYPECFPEHQSDFLFSLLFFFIFIVILSFNKKKMTLNVYKYVGGILVLLFLGVFVYYKTTEKERPRLLVPSRPECSKRIKLF